jgi:hypothetical protein
VRLFCQIFRKIQQNRDIPLASVPSLRSADVLNPDGLGTRTMSYPKKEETPPPLSPLAGVTVSSISVTFYYESFQILRIYLI